MSTGDWELLELAAKAAGVKDFVFCDETGSPFDALGYWNPLDCDGDALRLAAALKFTVDFESGAVWGAGDLDETRLGHTTADEPCVRRAIVRAAAEIGRRMA